MNLQTSGPGHCYPARLISLIALNILVLIMNAIAANDLSTIASSQQQLQLIFFTPNFFPSSTQASTIYFSNYFDGSTSFYLYDPDCQHVFEMPIPIQRLQLKRHYTYSSLFNLTPSPSPSAFLFEAPIQNPPMHDVTYNSG